MTNVTSLKSIRFIPVSYNYSTFTNNVPDENQDDKELAYEASDGGSQVEAIFSTIQGEQILLDLLSNLDTRDKVVLLYQILKEVGYKLEHEDCAKTLSLSRNGYVLLINKVKKKCAKILKHEKSKL